VENSDTTSNTESVKTTTKRRIITHKRMSIFPNALTVGNMFFGFWSIISSIELDYKWACYFIIFGGICDAFDGKVARLVKSTSDFGVEFDSLADVITFGTAPSLLMYMLYTNVYLSHYPALEDFSHIFFIISFFPLMFTGIRLARFNAELVGHDKEYFSGLPSPASAFTIIAFVLFELEQYESIQHLKWLTVTSIVVSYLMVSRVRYHGFPVIFQKGEKLILRYLKILGVILLLLSILKWKMSLLFPIMALFVLSGIVINLTHKLIRPAADTEEDLTSEDKLKKGSVVRRKLKRNLKVEDDVEPDEIEVIEEESFEE